MPENTDLSDDEISLTSTVPSEPQDEYEVECILAQRVYHGKEMYLVKWAGYPMERSTWETEDMFLNPQTLEDWAVKQEAIRRGEDSAFDVEALEQKWLLLEAATAKRKARRREKRKRLGYSGRRPPASSDPGHSDISDFVVPDDLVEHEQNSTSEDEPLMKKKRKASPTKEKKKFKTPAPPTRSDSAGQRSSFHNLVNLPSVTEPIIPTRPSHPTPSLPHHTNRSSQDFSSSSSNRQDRPRQPKLSVNTSSTAPALPPRTDHISHLFGGQKVRKSILDRISSKRKGELFSKLSTQRRWEKALRRERAPDVSQLELRRPQDWLHSPKMSNPQESPISRDHGTSYSLFVDQEDADLLPTNSRTNPQNPQEHFDDHQTRQTSSDQRPLWPNSTISPHDKEKTQEFTPRLSHRASTRRFWNPGEVLVKLKFGAVDKVIGDVRICGLNPTSKGQLLNLKSGTIDINFNDVCTSKEYEMLCDRRTNVKYANAWVVGYEDTAKEVTAMANYLRQNDLAAIWHHPAEHVQTAFIAYASSSTSWNFFDRDMEFPPNSSLRIVARSYLPTVSTVRRQLTSPSVAEPQMPPSQSTATTAPQNPIVIDDPVSTTSKSVTVLASIPKDLGNKDIVSIFRERWSITFEELSLVNAPKKDGSARAFYLYFPPEAEEEFQLVLKFLRKYTNAIFSNRLKGDWERFAETVTSGTVLFHQSYIWYEFMPGLHKLLRRYVNVFNISLASPVKHIGSTTHLQRLFPHGSVILMTEDYMIHETEAALNAMKWFRSHSEKKYPGTWKMFFRPNILGWLSNIFDKWPDDKMYQIYCIIEYMIPEYPEGHYNWYNGDGSPDSLDGETDDEGQHHPFISPSFIPDYGSRKEDAHENIPKGLSQEERNMDHLVEYFAGWAICNCDKYRRFIVLSHHKPLAKWKKWQHLEHIDTQGFSRQYINNESKKQSSKTDHSSR
ncbi:hypothetical protein DIZ76_013025 [Coccidioides immitis]|nr:hypothetical protein DIZ76_013025 [Coccidioides immitis]